MQQSVQTQTIDIEGIGSQLTREFTEFPFDLLWNPHVENPLHQRFDGEQVGIDVLQIRHGLVKRVRSFIRTSTRGCRGSRWILWLAQTLLLLQILENPA